MKVTKDKKNTYVYTAQELKRWVVIDNVIEKNGKTTPHPEEAGLRFQLKQLDFWRNYFKDKYKHECFIIYSEVNE